MQHQMKSLAQSILEKSNQHLIKPSQVLIVFNVQNEFASPEGKLPCSDLSFVDRIKEIVPKFREKAGDIIWIRSEYEADRSVNDGSTDADQVMLSIYTPETLPHPVSEIVPPDAPVPINLSPTEKKSLAKKKSRHRLNSIFNPRKKKTVLPISSPEPAPESIPEVILPAPGVEELFLTSAAGVEPRCVPGSTGSEFVREIKDSVLPADTTIVTSHYSAVKGTDLINILRGRMASEVYVCGCISNLSIYATTADMIGHGFVIRVIEDCLGFRSLSDHEEGLKVMLGEDKMGLGKITSNLMHEDLDYPPDNDLRKAEHSTKGLMSTGRKGLQHPSRSGGPLSDTGIAEAMAAMTIASGKGRVTITADGTTQNGADEAFAKDLQSSKAVPSLEGTVKNKIRVRNKKKKSKPPEDSQDSVLAAESHQSATAESQIAAYKPMLPPDAQAQVIAAMERLSMIEVGKSASKAKESPECAESSSKFRGAPASTQPRFDSSLPEKALDVIKHKAAPPADHLHESKQREEKEPKTLGAKQVPQVREEIKAREPTAEQVRPSHSTPAEPVLAMPKVYQPSNSPGKKPQVSNEQSSATLKIPSLANLPTLGPKDKIGEGDSFVSDDLLPPTLRDQINPDLALGDTIFHALYHEVQWQTMYHAAGAVPRLVAVQGAISAKGDKPLYRHPSDQSPPLLPFSKNVDIVRKEAEKLIGHDLNHVLIQLYRDGKDFISEHSDKTLDVVRGSKIVNASFGAQRTMRLRTRKSGAEAVSESAEAEEAIVRQTQRIPLPNNSLFVLGLQTNKIWLHGITPDKRMAADRSPVELAYNGMRISLTFRYIGTFLDKDEKTIWGQGAVGKTRAEARNVINGDEKETERMILAFGRENKESAGFDWEEVYGKGFDVLHFRVVEGGI